jgi:hypothetical protein
LLGAGLTKNVCKIFMVKNLEVKILRTEDLRLLLWMVVMLPPPWDDELIQDGGQG